MLKGTIVSTILVGGALTTALVTWNGGGAIDSAKSLITNQQETNQQLKANEGKLIDKIGSLKGKITTLNTQVDDLKKQLADAVAGGTADEQTIANLKQQISDKNAEIASLNQQINDLNSQLASSDADGEKLAQRIKDLEAQVQEANKDAADLQNTVDTTVVQKSDEDAVAAALSDDTATGETETPAENTDNPTEPTPPANTGETQADGSTQIGMLSDVPYFMGQGLTLDTKADGTVTITNASETPWTAKVNGQTVTITDNGTAIAIGKTDDLNNKNLTLSASGKADMKFFLIKK
jgi:regulator of replication initiation timing